jgi:hypothetical protein
MYVQHFFIIILYIQELNWVQNNSILFDSIVNLKKKKLKQNNHHRTFHLKKKVTSTKIDSSYEIGKNSSLFCTSLYTASIVGILFAEKNECTVFQMRYF